MKYVRSRWTTKLACLAIVMGLGAACGDDDKPDGGGDPGLDAGDSGGDSGKDGGGSGIDGSSPDGGSRMDGGGGNPQTDGATPTPDGSVVASDGAVIPGTDGSVTLDAGPPPCNASAAPAVPALKLEPVPGVGTLPVLVFAAQPPGSTDWYLVQQSGLIKVLSGGALKATPFLDVSSNIAVAANDERGLLGLAFPPDYATTGKFYVMMTPTSGGDANADTVLEYTRSAADPYVADATTKKEIVKLPPSDSNHNGGNILFGNDGFLYVGTGDGGGGCNSSKPGAPQDVSTLFGKILRLDPKAAAPYAAAGNPFATGGDARVYHYGLRNPYRYGLDRATGDLYIGDVGQDRYEEVDFASVSTPGLNFGWPKFEGNHVDTCGTDKALRAGSTDTKPVVDIPRAAGAPPPFGDYLSVIGGRVYRGSAIPSLSGVYLFGDFKGLRLGALRQCGATTSPVTPILKNKDANAPTAAFLARQTGQAVLDEMTAIVEDSAGEVYLLANRNSLLKVVPGP